MRPICILLLGLLACSAHAAPLGEALSQDAQNVIKLNAEAVLKGVKLITDEVHRRFEEGQARVHEAVERLTEGHPVREALGSHKGRRLQTITQNVQGFLGDMLGRNWTDYVPTSWSSPSFDWSHLGEFDYGSNLGDFLDTHDLKNLTDIKSMKDLTKSVERIEEFFCTPESFSKSEKVPASCTGPSVTIAVTPKTCVLESKTKQIICEPAKLVLTKTPGSCTHKYKSASVWVGKECKITGIAGFSDSVVIGGAAKNIPLTQVDLSYEFR